VNWSNLERALARVGTATLSLSFHQCQKLHPHEERILRLFSRCHELIICVNTLDGYTFSSSITMPHLEYLQLHIDKNAHIEPFLDSIESSSPLLSSLYISGSFPASLVQREHLLNQLVQLELCSPPDDNISLFRGLRNLEDLT